jgi:hypothetical protein
MSVPFILGRIAVRTGVALWRHRLGVLLALVAVVAFSAYELTMASPSVTNGDCADITITALTHSTEASARAAYACLAPSMRTMSEDQFVATMRQRGAPGATVDRIAERSDAEGGKIVFYTVEASNMPKVGYIVYLNADGKVVRVE